MATAHDAPHPDRLVDHAQPTVLVGWTHRDLARGIELKIESSRSLVALENGRVETARLCMTRNQALLLARYLLNATGQTLAEEEPKPGLLRRWFGR